MSKHPYALNRQHVRELRILVQYDLSECTGEDADIMKALERNLKGIAFHAFNRGMVTGDLPATVDTWSAHVGQPNPSGQHVMKQVHGGGEYLVEWSIDITAQTPHDAATQALEIQRAPESTATFFEVTDPQGRRHQIDLMQTRRNVMNARRCPCCGVGIGELHKDLCSVERDPDSGLQMLRNPKPTRPRLPWTGEWPGEAECREFGWYARPLPGQGWVQCEPRPDASPDINRLYSEAVWDAEAGRFLRRQ